MRNIVGLVVLVMISVAAASRATEKGLDEQRKEFKQLVADEWEYEMRETPELATIVGDYRYNDRWSNLSLAHVTRQTRVLRVGCRVSRQSIRPLFRNRKS